LETTACVTYSFRAKYYYKGIEKHLVPIGNEIVSEFIGLCKQKRIPVCVTKTVNDEAFGKLHTVVNRYFDRARIFAPAVMQNVYLKVRKRLIELTHYTGNRDVSSNIEPIKTMYTQFTKDPKQLGKLEVLKSKKHRNDLIPSTKDMTILSEAVTLCKESKVYLITDDGDFSVFKSEIEQGFGVTVVELMNLRTFATELLSPRQS
jgi:hypothetical protein